jgi:hypothetical protein
MVTRTLKLAGPIDGRRLRLTPTVGTVLVLVIGHSPHATAAR